MAAKINPKVPISELKIGPFAGGINNYSNASAIADSELVDCINFDIDLDGSLKSRPPMHCSGIPYASTTTPIFEANTKVLGTYTFDGLRLIVYQYTQILNPSAGVYSIDQRVEGYWVDGSFLGTTFLLTSDTYSSGSPTIANPYTTISRYKNTLYMFRATGGGGKYVVNAVTGSGAFTAGTYPAASKSVVYKERMWLCGDKTTTNPSRLYFSDIALPDTYQPASFFDIRPGDGDTLNDMIVYQDNLFIFKNSSIWVFAYDTQPAQAVLQQLHNSLGVDNESSIALYENVIYFLKWGQVYQIADYVFTRISTKLPFADDRTLPTPVAGTEAWINTKWKYYSYLSLVGDRLVVRFYNRTYVYHLRMRAWTRWTSQDNVLHYSGQFVKLEDSNLVSTLKRSYNTYVAGGALTVPPFKSMVNTTVRNITFLSDVYDPTTGEYTKWTGSGLPDNVVDIMLSIKSKIYDVGISHRFKRLMHWGVDVVTGRDVTGILSPYSLAYRVTWEQLHGLMWNQLQTWGYPLFAQPNNTQTTLVDAGVYRRYIRFPKSLRYRLLQFEVQMVTKGNQTDGPAQLYSLTAFTAQKQLVPKGVN
jgi:hypothetical protein